MVQLFLNLLNISITASWIVLAVVLLRFVLKKSPKWVICLLWAIVALRLVMPFSLESVFSLLPDQQAINTDTHQAQTGIDPIDNAVNSYLGESSEVIPDYIGTSMPVTYTPVSQETADPLLAICNIWVAGMALMALYSLLSWLLLHRRVGESIPYRDNIYICDRVDSAFVLGMIRPRIYLSSVFSEEEMCYVISHEQSHLDRKDHLWKPLGFMLLTVYWFNPALWLAYILLCRDIELACDEKTIRNMDLEAKKGYSNTLLSCCIHRRMITACPVAFGEVGIKARIKSVANYKKPTFWVIVVALISCIAMAVCFLTDPIVQAQAGSYRYVEEEFEKFQAAESTMTDQERYLAYADLFQLISEGARNEAEQFAELFRTITNNQDPFPYVTSSCATDVFPVAKIYGNAYTRLATGTSLGTYFTAVYTGNTHGTISVWYLGAMQYSVKMINVGESWNQHHTNLAVPYDGSLGKYLVEIAFYDSGSISQKPPDRSLTTYSQRIAGAKWDIKSSYCFTDLPSRNCKLYFGCDLPFHVEEQPLTEANEAINIITIPVTFQTGVLYGYPTPVQAFPAAPRSADIQALPDTYDASTLVSTYWEQATLYDRFSSYPKPYYISIPQLYPFSADAVACQEEIFALFKKELDVHVSYLFDTCKGKNELLDMPEDVFFSTDYSCYSYHAGCYKDVLSIAIRMNFRDVPWSTYSVYYLDLNTGKRLTAEEVHSRFNVSNADIKRALESYFYKMFPDADSSSDREYFDRTLSDENINSCRLFCTEDGKLMIAAKVYGFSTMSMQEKLIPLFD